MIRLECHVTDKLIVNGEPLSAYSCPVALSIMESDQRIKHAFVSTNKASIQWNDTDHLASIDLPANAVEFIASFDRDKRVQPISFILYIPDAPPLV